VLRAPKSIIVFAQNQKIWSNRCEGLRFWGGLFAVTSTANNGHLTLILIL
jgi:hypothetical protein